MQKLIQKYINTPSPVHQINVFDKNIYVKRDDLLGYYFSGNKARKLRFLFDKKFNQIISYGGSQSNAMLSLAALAKIKNAKFDYICKKIPIWVKNQNFGNLYEALKLGMNLIEVEHQEYHNKINNLQAKYKNALIIKQGGATKEAEIGISELSNEIIAFADTKKIDELHIFISSATGTTALYLQKNLPKNFKVWTTPSVGDINYLKKQWLELEKDNSFYPAVLETSKKYTFAKPNKDFLQIYQLLKDKNLEIDLIYEPKIFIALKENIKKFTNKNIMYIHSGGKSGNKTQLARYFYLYSPSPLNSYGVSCNGV